MSLKSNFASIRRGLRPACQTAQRREGVRGVSIARVKVAKETTSLMRTIRNEEPDDLTVAILAGDPSATRPSDGKPVDYGPHLEYGTSKMAAQPFMGPMSKELRPAQEIRAEVLALYRRNGV